MGIQEMTIQLPDSWDMPEVKPYEVKYIINQPTSYELELIVANVDILIHSIHYTEGRTTDKRKVDYIVVSYLYAQDKYRNNVLDDLMSWYDPK